MNENKTFPILETEKLILREIKDSDKNRIHFLRSDKEVTKFINRKEVQTLEVAIAHIKKLNNFFIEDKSIAWGITLKNSDELVGSICLWNYSEDRKTAEIGYDLDTKFHKKDIMSEAMDAICDFGFNKMNFETIEAFTDGRNMPSRKLLEKHHFILIPDKKDEGNEHNVIYSLSR